MSDVVSAEAGVLTRAKTEDGKFRIHRTFFDDKALGKNKRLRESGVMDKSKLGLHENEDIRAIISCPDVEQWNTFCFRYPDIYGLIKSPNEQERMLGTRKLAAIHPDWVIYTRL